MKLPTPGESFLLRLRHKEERNRKHSKVEPCSQLFQTSRSSLSTNPLWLGQDKEGSLERALGLLLTDLTTSTGAANCRITTTALLHCLLGSEGEELFGPAFLITSADEITSYLDKRSVMFSSFIPPKTLNFFKLQTCVFSYLPNVMLWTMAGLSSFRIKYCGRENSEFQY